MKFFIIALFSSSAVIASAMKCVDRLEAIHQFDVLKMRLKSFSSEEQILDACAEDKIADLVTAKKFRESRLAPVKAELYKHKKLLKTYKFNPYFRKGETKVSVCHWKGKVNKDDIELIETYLAKDYDSASLVDACRFVGLSYFRSGKKKAGPGKR